MRPENLDGDLWIDCDAVEDLKPLNSTELHLPVKVIFICLSEVSLSFPENL